MGPQGKIMVNKKFILSPYIYGLQQLWPSHIPNINPITHLISDPSVILINSKTMKLSLIAWLPLLTAALPSSKPRRCSTLKYNEAQIAAVQRVACKYLYPTTPTWPTYPWPLEVVEKIETKRDTPAEKGENRFGQVHRKVKFPIHGPWYEFPILESGKIYINGGELRQPCMIWENWARC